MDTDLKCKRPCGTLISKVSVIQCGFQMRWLSTKSRQVVIVTCCGEQRQCSTSYTWQKRYFQFCQSNCSVSFSDICLHIRYCRHKHSKQQQPTPYFNFFSRQIPLMSITHSSLSLNRWGWNLARRRGPVPSSMPNFTPNGATTRV